MPLNRDEIPKSHWEHNYQVGLYLFSTRWGAVIWWRSVSKRKFIAKYFNHVSQLSEPEDVLALFHAGDLQRFGRQCFRALKA